MNRRTVFLAVFVCCAASTVYADYSVWDTGAWPKSWPVELEPLRKQARTLEGPLVPYRHYLIPFTTREEFEAAWPHLLKVKSKGAPIILVRAPKTDFFAIKPAGVFIHAPPADADKEADPEEPISGEHAPRSRWIKTTYIELAVDGMIVDLNRIRLPADTPIIDERFENGNRPGSRALADETADVSGQITLDGKPLAGGRILLHQESGQFVGAKIDKDLGNFKLDRISVGRYKVSVESKGVPDKYASAEHSEIIAEVKAGMNVFDFNLKSK